MTKAGANAGNMGSDFQILGLALWPGLRARRPNKVDDWNRAVEHLNTVRNGVAHSDKDRIAEAHAEEPLILRNWKRKRAILDKLAREMDALATEHVTALTGRAPW